MYGKNTALARFSHFENPKTALDSDTLDAVHYGIHLTDISLTGKTIKGYTEVQLVSKVMQLSSIKLELASLEVDSVFIGDKKTNAFNHSADKINISLQEALFKGDTVQVAIYYHGHPFVDASGWGGFHFSGDYALNLGVGFATVPHNLGKAWFPCIDDFHDRALYDVYLTVPGNKKAISGGILVDVTDNGNNTYTWHWKTKYTLPTYLISATTGPYELVADTCRGLCEIIPITYYCRPADTTKVAGTFVNMKKILRVFEDRFGPYPFERVGNTATPGRLGAMEHASNVSYPFSGWTGNTSREGWYAHELSHMWFGNKVTCSTAEDMWLNEGWAVWCESLYREMIYGKQAYRDNMRSKLKSVLQSAHLEDGAYYALYGIPQTITYGTTVYQKGGQVAHTLRGYLGDSLFFGGVKAYLQKYAYNFASTYDLRDFLSAYSRVDLNPFFDAWVFTPGFPHFSIASFNTVKSKDKYDVTVFVHQKLKGRTQYANSNHLEITFINNKWQMITDTMVFSGAVGQKTFCLPFSPVEVMADANEKISDAATDEIKVIKSAGEYNFGETFCRIRVKNIADSAFVRIIHNWVAPESTGTLQTGIRISDSRYWTVQGIFPPGFSALGEFVYKADEGFDKNLITNVDDTLIILYRLNAGQPWKEVAAAGTGSRTSGAIVIDKLQRGEYTLGVRKSEHMGKTKK